jgi:hypothetical protein
VIIRYGGYDTANLELFGGEIEISNGTISHSAAIGVFAEDTDLHLDNSTIADNAADGLWLYGHSKAIAPVLVDNVFRDNGTFAAYLIFNGGCDPETEMHGNTGWGNGDVNGIYVEGFVHTPTGCRWGPNPQMPYVVWTIEVSDYGRLELEPGVEMKFVGDTLQRGTGTFIIDGTLEAIGTADAPIAFTSFWDDSVGGDSDGTSLPALAGDWIGFVVNPGANVALDHTIVRYGGANGTNLSVSGASLQLTNSEITYSADRGLGIEIKGTGQPITVKNNPFINNTGYAATVWANTSSPVTFNFEGNEGWGNGVNGILLDAALDTLAVKPNPGLPYVIQSVSVASGRTVTVNPGVVFKGDQEHSGGGSLFSVDGVLRVQGTASDRVYFTSLHDDSVGGDTLSDGGSNQPAAGNWRGINLSSSGEADLSYTTLRYAGSDEVGLLNGGGRAIVDHSDISHNRTHGIGNLGGGVLSVTNSVISHNTANGIGNGSTATINYNDIMNNSEYGVFSYAPGLINAEHNYWGSAEGPSWDGNYCPSPPQGRGDQISCHSVDYEPFSTSPYH